VSEDSNGRGTNIAALNQKVLGLESDVQNIGQRLDAGLANLRQDFVASFERINAKLDNRDDRRWIIAPAIGFMMLVLAIIGGLGTMSLGPVKEDVHRLREDALRLRGEATVTERDLIERDRRLWDFVLRQRSEFDFMRGQMSRQ
jgi:hypothetical protein